MTSSFLLTLDTTGPALAPPEYPSISGVRLIELKLLLEEEGPFAGYQFKVWGDVDPEADPNVQATEGESEWMTWGELAARVFELTLSEGDGTKTLSVKARDDVWNESTTREVSLELDTTVPVITITAGPDASKISKITGKDTSHFTFKANEDLAEYEVRAVPEEGSGHEAGNLVYNGGGITGETNEAGSITGAELQAAVGADGQYIIKVFGKSAATGLWSI